jgi:hypothetical protein
MNHVALSKVVNQVFFNGFSIEIGHFWAYRTLTVLAVRAMNVSLMRLEAKYLPLRGPVTIGSQFDEWRVCWLGGWAKHRLFYMVMVVRVVESNQAKTRDAAI